MPRPANEGARMSGDKRCLRHVGLSRFGNRINTNGLEVSTCWCMVIRCGEEMIAKCD